MERRATAPQDGSALGPEKAAIVDYVAGRPLRACFVDELRAAVGVTDDQIEMALRGLVESGAAVVQPHFCADPHFIDDDLRVVALVPPDVDDGERRAVTAGERLWQRWTADFLASHRCT